MDHSGMMRTTVLLFVGYVFSLGLFVAKAEATSKTIAVECAAEKNVDVTVAPDVDALNFTLSSDCFCDADAEKLKKLASSGQIVSGTSPGGTISLRPGETFELKLYCYTRSMLNLGPTR